MSTTVKTLQGELRGSVVDGVHVFLGVPYAAPPFGANRLMPPRPVEPWSGVRDATSLGPEPPQITPPTSGGSAAGAKEDWEEVSAAFAAIERAAASEDCLNLNVWTPDPDAVRLPVMVWIQGGMFEISSTAAYDGRNFARDGVVCVALNWRPGAEGFLHLADGIANVGLLDQVAALEWIRDNIASFGGDPDNVTVFGESAGAMSIGVLLAMPRAEGLFRRAILQSGAAHHVTPAEDALRIAGYLADRLGVPTDRHAMAAVSLDRFIAAQAELKQDLMTNPDPDRWGAGVVASNLPWAPAVDGVVVPGPPIERIRAGSSGHVDVLIGTNTDDWRLWLVASGAIAQVTDDLLTGPVVDYGYQSLGAYGLEATEALAAYRARHPDLMPGDLLATVQTDWWMRVPALLLAEGRLQGSVPARTYMYEFAWPAPGLGAVHALEVPFVFDLARPDVPLFGGLVGPEPPQELARAMHAAWIAFATSGDPGWPAYDLSRRATMRFDLSPAVVDDPRHWERDFWKDRR